MIVAISILLLSQGNRLSFDPPKKIAPAKWITTNWPSRDPFADAWHEYAKVLRDHPGYVDNSGWPEKVKADLVELGKHPNDPWTLYKASATYLTAYELDWRFELPPEPESPIWRSNSSAIFAALNEAWKRFPRTIASREFCRVGFAVCAPNEDFDGGELPMALHKAFPKDRIVISSLVWYSATHTKPVATTSWLADQVSQLLELPGSRPRDYLTVAFVYGMMARGTTNLSAGQKCRDALVEFRRRVPAEMAKRLDRDLRGANAWVKQHGG